VLIGHTSNAFGARQGLVDHLEGVAQLSGEFARALGAPEAGRMLGLWHDVGED